MELAQGLEKLQPYGQANPKPVFRMCDVTVSKLRFMGDDAEHADSRQWLQTAAERTAYFSGKPGKMQTCFRPEVRSISQAR